jgi:hypothetical protein
MKPRKGQPQAVAFGQQPLAARLFGGSPERTLSLLRAAWPAAVGPELARRTEVVALDGRMLRVRVPDARWQKVLHRLQRPILERLWRSTGDLAPKSLGFHQGFVATPPASPPAEPRAVPPPPIPAAIEQAAQTISDPDLRERYAQTAARYLHRQKDK